MEALLLPGTNTQNPFLKEGALKHRMCDEQVRKEIDSN